MRAPALRRRQFMPDCRPMQDWSGCDLAVCSAPRALSWTRPAGQRGAGRGLMEATALHQKPATLAVRALSPALGAEISGVDLRDPIDHALKQQFLGIWHQHLVILLRNQTLDEDTQVHFAE